MEPRSKNSGLVPNGSFACRGDRRVLRMVPGFATNDKFSLDRYSNWRV